MNSNLQWELDWIDRNKHLYDGDWHVLAVKGSITRRYKIAALEAEIKKLQEQLEEKCNG